MGYSSEEDVYEECGMTSTVIQNLTNKNAAEVTALVLKYIESADQKIKRVLKVPITIRKEEHEFIKEGKITLGPYEDNLEFFGNYDPTNCATDVFAIYSRGFGKVAPYYHDVGGRRKLPYPADCDELTEDITDMTAGTDTTISKDTTDFKAGVASIKAIFAPVSGTDYSLFFPQNANLDKRIYAWYFVSFWFKTSDKTATYTLTLYDIDGNASYKTFNARFNNTWEIITLELSAFTNYIDWGVINLQKVKLSSNKVGTVRIDNFSFNDGIFWTLPEGLICWSDPTSDPIGYFQVTYAFDPYAVETPPDIAECSAKLASVKILDYCIGARERYIAFQQMSEDMDKTPDKESLEVVRGRIIADVNRMLAEIGIGTNESIGSPV